MDNDYQRVIPRDLFNEAKLLKCYGQLALLILDGKTDGLPLTIDHCDFDVSGFEVMQDGARALLYCSNLTLTIGDNDLYVGTPVNSKEPWPMVCATDEEDELPVFNPDGNLSAEFVDYLKTL